MIAYLEGVVKEITEESATILVQGVGYLVFASKNTLEDLQGKEFVSVFVHTHLREDALSLFAFSTIAEKEVFFSLTSVNGIGPKVALKILSGTRVEELVRWIGEGNIGALTQLPKVGKKTAEQILFSLKDKIFLKSAKEKTDFKSTVKKDIFSALVNLGYSSAEVEKVVAPMPVDVEFQAGVRDGLSQLSGHS